MADASEKGKKVCYYELLGLDRKCEAAEIKASYRKLALQMHPDKAHVHGLSVEEATQRFQQIQEAYGVLSDAQERAWYDAHREQILKGDDGPGEDPFKTKINLYKYFSASCFEGFGDGSRGFFGVYAELFEAIDQEEAEWEDADEEDHTALPPFGRSDAEWADVAAFYRHWLDFCSRKAFGHADKWNPKEAENRQVRRAMEQENKKCRQGAKKEFNAEVRQLVRFVQKRDPRVAAHQKQKMQATVEKKQRDLADKQQRKATEAQERQERKEAARRADEERWAEAAAAREARKARGELVSEDEASEKESEAFEYRCEPCRKSFKSEKAFDQHAKSKKHLQIVASLRKELEKELAAEAEEAEEDDDSDAEEAGGGDAASGSRDGAKPGAGAKEGAQGKGAGKEEDGSEDEDEDEDEDSDDFAARLAAVRRKPAAASAPPRGEGAGAGSGTRARRGAAGGAKEESGSEEDGDDGTGSDEGARGGGGAASGAGGKKAQKRAKQQAILLEKRAEKANVQDLVQGCRKAAKGGSKDREADAAAPEDHAQLPSGQAADTSRCAVCGESFSSRTKLFQHIKATGHAALKPTPAAEAAAAKGHKKKR